VSTIKVDTIQTRGGVSEIAIDKLKGASSTSSISVVAEGGTTTTNLQQGLVKAWVFSGDDASLTNAFNVASGTDNSTGNYTFTYTSNLANGNPSAAASVTDNSDRNATVYSTSTTAFTTEVFVQNGSESDTRNRTIICGDLA
tara:strand:+ start:96 stop:521 length:426 start_codon:yes stop_codon:yes gene_type:complete